MGVEGETQALAESAWKMPVMAEPEPVSAPESLGSRAAAAAAEDSCQLPATLTAYGEEEVGSKRSAEDAGCGEAGKIDVHG
jgi:hypothetical protein